MEFSSMTCRNCGGKLAVDKESDQVICQYCGMEFLITHYDGAISIKVLSQGLEKIGVSTDKTASELALKRLKGEKELLQKTIEDTIVKPLGKYYDINYKTYTLDADRTFRFLKDELQMEIDAFPKSKEKISLLTKLLGISATLLEKWNEIEKEEEKHRRIVQG